MKRYILLPLIIMILLLGYGSRQDIKNTATVSSNQPQIIVTYTTSSIVNSFENVDSGYSLESLNIELPLNWKVEKSNKSMYLLLDTNGQKRGWISYQSYDVNFGFERIRPNHASLIEQEKLDIPLGQCTLYTMEVDNGTPVSGISGTHLDYYSIISIKDKAIYTLEFSLNDKKLETKSQFIKILEGLSFKNISSKTEP